jgi:hypothetical protein
MQILDTKKPYLVLCALFQVDDQSKVEQTSEEQYKQALSDIEQAIQGIIPGTTCAVFQPTTSQVVSGISAEYKCEALYAKEGLLGVVGELIRVLGGEAPRHPVDPLAGLFGPGSIGSDGGPSLYARIPPEDLL